jgi:hypothetical protein
MDEALTARSPDPLLGPTAASPARLLDLRRADVADVLDRVERALQTKLERTDTINKRRSIGARTERDTWVRIEVRRPEKIDGQGWNGTECAAFLEGVTKPTWYAATSWHDRERGVMWRADETSLVTAAPIKPAGILTVDPHLPDAWWRALKSSLAALASAPTTRLSTPDTEPITQDRITSVIEHVFPSRVDSFVDEWTTAHADLNWANLTGPEFCLLDWEDWGRAPRGLDAANLWVNSLAVPTLARRVGQLLCSELDSRTGKLVALFQCAQIIAAVDESDPLLAPATVEAAVLLEDLAG